MRFSIPYGTTELTASLDWARVIDPITVADAAPLNDPVAALHEGLAAPIGAPPLDQALYPGAKVLIIVSDSFRKTEIHHVLPALTGWLNSRGVPDPCIQFLFATGSHRPPTPEEQAEILGPAVYQRFKSQAFAHDPHDESKLVYRGATRRGTPVYINRLAAEADVVIATGTVVLHYFGGFGGGRKSIVPGIAGMRTIAANHALNLDPDRDTLNPDVAIGRLAGNPVAEDMLEAARLGQVDFIINTVRNRQGVIAGLFCGALEEAHRAACDCARDLFTVPLAEKADFVVASAGTAKNFVQSHKSLYNAYQVVKEGGPIVLAAPAPEGYGGDRFAAWLALGNTGAIIAELRRNAEINGQTALSTLEKARHAILITELSTRETEALGGRRASSLAEALSEVRRILERRGITRPTCYLMPDAATTVPVYRGVSSRQTTTHGNPPDRALSD